MTTMKKILAFPAYVSSRFVAAIWPDKVAQVGWDGLFDLSCMYRRGYIFGAVVWMSVLGGIALMAL